MEGRDPRYWHSRGYLPHFDQDGFTQFITFRLADSVPKSVIENWKRDRETGNISEADYRRRIETYLDQNYGAGHLRNPAIATIVEDTLLKFDGERYRLISCVNHA